MPGTSSAWFNAPLVDNSLAVLVPGRSWLKAFKLMPACPKGRRGLRVFFSIGYCLQLCWFRQLSGLGMRLPVLLTYQAAWSAHIRISDKMQCYPKRCMWSDWAVSGLLWIMACCTLAVGILLFAWWECGNLGGHTTWRCGGTEGFGFTETTPPIRASLSPRFNKIP
jgi:hypothetical protein